MQDFLQNPYKRVQKCISVYKTDFWKSVFNWHRLRHPDSLCTSRPRSARTLRGFAELNMLSIHARRFLNVDYSLFRLLNAGFGSSIFSRSAF